jgi:acyl carrier protein
MVEQDLLSRVVTIIKPFAKDQDALARATTTSRVLEDLKVNSARLVDIILAFEREFDIEVGDDDAGKVQTIGDAIGIIEAKLAAR